MTKPLDVRKNRVGDEVDVKTTHDVKSNGHVTKVQAYSKDQANSELGIAFDHAMPKDGTEIPLPLRIQAIGKPRFAASAGEDDLARGSATVSPGGLLGGIGSTTTGAASEVAAAAHSAGLALTSQGVVGLRGLTLSNQTSASDSTQGSVISSSTGNVHLDRGTEMILRVNQ